MHIVKWTLFVSTFLMTQCTQKSRRPSIGEDGHRGRYNLASDAKSIVFAAFGDMGTGSLDQYRVADALSKICQQRGCEFVVGLGDSIYGRVSSVDDQQFAEKFEKPYQNIRIPFYMSLGNHDVTVDISPQIDYTDQSKKWRLPKEYYSFQAANANSSIEFWSINTNPLTLAWQQGQWLSAGIKNSEATWRVVFGHHPWKSNGHHGDASKTRQQFFEDHFCHKVDFYLAGHDHDKQHLHAECGVHLAVIGTGAKLRPAATGKNSYYAVSSLGFAVFEMNKAVMVMDFYDEQGRLEYSSRFEKN